MDCSSSGFPVLHYPGVCSNSCPRNWWGYLTTASSVIPFFSCLQSFPASGSFKCVTSVSGGQRIEASASASVIPKNIQGWCTLGLTGLISLLSSGLLRVLQHHNLKASRLQHSAFLMVQLLHPYMKTIALTVQTFVSQVMSLLFNMLFRFVIDFLPKSKCSFIAWLELPSTVILEPKKMKSVNFHFSPIYLPWSDGTWCHDLWFLNVEF